MPLHFTGFASRRDILDPEPLKPEPKSFERVLKYNPNHGADGRFTSGGGGGEATSLTGFRKPGMPPLKPVKDGVAPANLSGFRSRGSGKASPHPGKTTLEFKPGETPQKRTTLEGGPGKNPPPGETKLPGHITRTVAEPPPQKRPAPITGFKYNPKTGTAEVTRSQTTMERTASGKEVPVTRSSTSYQQFDPVKTHPGSMDKNGQPTKRSTFS